MALIPVLRNHRYRYSLNPDPTQIKIVDDKKIKHFKKENVLIKNCNFFNVLRPPPITSMLKKKPPILQREHPALQNVYLTVSLFYFLVGNFVPSWIQIYCTDPLGTVQILIRKTANFQCFCEFAPPTWRRQCYIKQHFVRLVQKNLCSKASKHCPFKQFFYIFQITNRTKKNVCGMQCSTIERAPGMWPLPFFSLINIL